LQQESARKLGFAVKKTMMVAQKLYEGVEIGAEGAVGLITYMRTDSTRVSETALGEVRDFVGAQYGAQYLPEKPSTTARRRTRRTRTRPFAPRTFHARPIR
jgi:DNA topoisomerase-1